MVAFDLMVIDDFGLMELDIEKCRTCLKSSSPEIAAKQLLLSHRFQYPDGINFLGIPPMQMPA